MYERDTRETRHDKFKADSESIYEHGMCLFQIGGYRRLYFTPCKYGITERRIDRVLADLCIPMRLGTNPHWWNLVAM